jgi:hypothetical protein
MFVLTHAKVILALFLYYQICNYYLIPGNINTMISRKHTIIQQKTISGKVSHPYLSIVARKYSNIFSRQYPIRFRVEAYMPDCNSFAGCNCDDLIRSEH